MEPTGKELNVDGNRIINLKNPVQDQDAATKHYTDRQVANFVWRVHTLLPTSTRDEYIRTINSKHITMVNLAPIVTIITDLKLISSYSEADDPHYWLEGLCASNRVWLPNQDLKGKHITVHYRFPINVDIWKLKLRYDKYQQFDIKFHWQGSNDGKEWLRLTEPIETNAIDNYWNGNTHEMDFKNTECTHDFYFWRIVFNKGVVPKHNNNDPWVNLLLMKLHE